ncbi:MAG: Uma2 family endonuclease [Defluviitaleaceae bacterium]|nr:Uma2 family endonuclease [Defluviitaleaceae bacterium]
MNLAYENLHNFEDDYREEILDGKVVKMAPSATPGHNHTTGNIYTIFRLNKQGCVVLFETDVHFSEKDRVCPDLIVVCNRDIVNEDGGIHGAPDLVVEILSPSTSGRDKKYKKDLYEREGVQEYWIVDTKSRDIEVFILRDGRYSLEGFYQALTDAEIERMNERDRAEKTYQFKTHLWDDVVVDVYEVFKGW